MTAPKVNWEINIGTIIHTLILVAGMFIAYGQFTIKFESYYTTLEATQKQTNRIEKYLSSQDKEYWQKVYQYGDR